MEDVFKELFQGLSEEEYKELEKKIGEVWKIWQSV